MSFILKIEKKEIKIPPLTNNSSYNFLFLSFPSGKLFKRVVYYFTPFSPQLTGIWL